MTAKKQTAAQQTAVDFLIEKSNALNKKVFDGSIGRIEHAFALAKIEEQARQMFMEQIERAFDDGYCDRHSDELTINNEIKKLKP